MKASKFLVFIQVMALMGLMLGTAGCIDENSGVQDELQATTPHYSEDDNTLAGTCPRGQHCGSPGCPLWSDQNNNGLCDRGE